MEIKCEKCNEDLLSLIDRQFMSYTVGKIVCPKCQKKQARYISESDLTLFLIASEVLYLILCSITVALYYMGNQSKWLTLLLLPLLIIYIFTLKIVARKIYLNSYNKKEYYDIDLNDDPKKVKKGINFRMLIFYCVSTTFLSIGSLQTYSILFIILSIGEAIIAYNRCLHQEKLKARIH